MRLRFIYTRLVIAALIVGSSAFCAAEPLREVRTPRDLDAAFADLAAVTDSRRAVVFDPERIAPILAFVLSEKAPGALYHPGGMDGATSAYHEFTIERSLADFLRLTYNPSLPSYLTVPSTVRLSFWSEIGGENHPMPRLWTHLDDLGKPFRIDGVETVVNTPDLFSGAYYAYDLDRTIILLRWGGKKIMLSLSKQRGKSDVGKKGAVLGPDKQWNYLYTGQPGLSRAGLGWVDSYMYDSFSVTAYVEIGEDSPRIRCGIFKWIRAGWAGINVVQTRHIYRGLVRFADAFKTIVEAPQLTDTEALVQRFHGIQRLPEETLRKKTAAYYRRLQDLYGDDSPLLRDWFKSAFGENGHLAQMSRREMEAVVSIETLKYLLGKNPEIEVVTLQEAGIRNQQPEETPRNIARKD
ncbi:MAG: hypothetical protein PVG78_13010 [Desulfobacterales bacterium]|jgi:hypothetical protein